MKNSRILNALILAVLFALITGCQKKYDLVTGNKKQPALKMATVQQSTLKMATVHTILAPQNISVITDRFFVEGQTTPSDKAYMVVRWQDDVSHTGNAISINPSYNPSSYTGFTPPTPFTSWQRGEFNDATNGSPVFQLNGTYGGILMNSWFTTYQTIVGGGQNTTYEYKFSSPSAPWPTSTSKLWIQSDLQLPWFANWDNNGNGNAPVGQLSFVIYLKDVLHNKVVCVVMNAYDNRSSTPIELVGTDTFTYFASTRFGGTTYSTPNAYSSSWRNTTWNTYNFYRAEITRQNLINIVTNINSNYGQNFSTNPEDYVLTSAGILQETFREQGDQVSMGASFRDFSVYEDR